MKKISRMLHIIVSQIVSNKLYGNTDNLLYSIASLRHVIYLDQASRELFGLSDSNFV